METIEATTPATSAARVACDYFERATYSPEDNKLRLYPTARLPADLYARVKAAGFSWAPKQELFVAPMWTPGRADLAAELAGPIEDEDTTLAERAEMRADRFDGYRDNRKADASQHLASAQAIAGRFEFGQPILIGHHSQARAERDRKRMHGHMSRAVSCWDTAEYWRHRAAGAISHALYKEAPGVRHRRIKGIEADLRKVTKQIEESRNLARIWTRVSAQEWDKQTAAALYVAGHTPGGYDLYSPLHAGTMHGDTAWRRALASIERYDARAQRWAEHYRNRLAYERAMLAESGGIKADAWDLQPGGTITHRGRRSVILRVNARDGVTQSVTVTGQGWTVGVEEITAYEPPTEATAAAAAKVTKLAPLCNYDPGTDKCARMIEAQYKDLHEGARMIRRIGATETHEVHRVRHIMGYRAREYGYTGSKVAGYDLVPVFLTDAKVKPAPTIGGEPPAPRKPRKTAAQRIAEAAGVDTAAPQGEPAPAATSAETLPAVVAQPQATCVHLGRVYGVLATFPEGEHGTAAANAYCESTPGAAVLCVQAGRVIVTATSDLGREMTRDEVRAVIGEATAPTMDDVRRASERLQRARAREEVRKAEAAPFEAVRQALKDGGPVAVSAPQLFPTPAHIAARMVDLAEVRPGCRVLEPSAGTGALVGAVLDAEPSARVDAIEVNRSLADRLRSLWPGVDVRCQDFTAADRPAPVFDVVLMNPPFANADDVRHILHARRFLAPGGRLVAICANGPRQAAALQPLADTWEELPAGTFEGTNVRTVLLTMGAE